METSKRGVSFQLAITSGLPEMAIQKLAPRDVVMSPCVQHTSISRFSVT